MHGMMGPEWLIGEPSRRLSGQFGQIAVSAFSVQIRRKHEQEQSIQRGFRKRHAKFLIGNQINPAQQ